MNDAFNESKKEGELAHWKLISEVIAEVETYAMSNEDRERDDYYPKHMYYIASEEEEEARFHSKYSISGVSSGSCARGNDETKQEIAKLKEHVASSHGGIDEVKQELVDLKAHVASSRDNDEVKQELAKLRAHVASSRGNGEVKQELAKLKEHVASSHDGIDEVKQELAELKELVKNLISQLKANVPS
ncbi:hypothetical protein BGZ65_007636 [Modicella reniformis]|uniref:Uncharacterized protein n=1 Tax=Modicella reniformis TaxID=1440133 RepID=A0A9P6M880_9FUNG|nr:hypothetical protein BGZ65_007636 [Modicella reniformis]